MMYHLKKDLGDLMTFQNSNLCRNGIPYLSEVGFSSDDLSLEFCFQRFVKLFFIELECNNNNKYFLP